MKNDYLRLVFAFALILIAAEYIMQQPADWRACLSMDEATGLLKAIVPCASIRRVQIVRAK